MDSLPNHPRGKSKRSQYRRSGHLHHSNPPTSGVGLPFLSGQYATGKTILVRTRRSRLRPRTSSQGLQLQKRRREDASSERQTPWFQRASRQRVKINPVIGHLKRNHRMKLLSGRWAIPLTQPEPPWPGTRKRSSASTDEKKKSTPS